MIGNGVSLGSQNGRFDGNWMCLQEYSTDFGPGSLPSCEAAIASAIPVPAAVWLFGSALGFAAWWRRQAVI